MQPTKATTSNPTSNPRILLLGAGYANIALLKSLPSTALTSAHFTLITDSPAHCESVLLHEVASGQKSREILHPLADILPSSVEIIYDRVQAIHAHEKRVSCAKSSYGYDMLVVGLGFRPDSFGIKGVGEYALPLTNFAQAQAVQEKITQNLQLYKSTKDTRYLRFVVCGGGFSGCELVASLAQSLPKLARQNGIEARPELVCIEALPNILPMFPPNLAQKGRAYLERLGVIVRSSCKILACEKDGVIVLDSGAAESSTDSRANADSRSGKDSSAESSHAPESSEKIASFCVIWTAGVQGSEVIERSFGSPKSRVQITPYLHPKALESTTPTQESTQDSAPESTQESSAKSTLESTIDTESIFVLGDCSALLDEETNRFHPPTAQIAGAQGRYVAKILADRLSGDASTPQPLPAPFTYTPQGTICSLGSYYGVGLIGTQRPISGLLAIAIKRASEWRWRRVLKRA